MSNWHAIMYPIKPGTEERVRDLFEQVTLPRRKVYDEDGDLIAELLSTKVFVGDGKALRLIEFTGALPWIVGHLRGEPAAVAFQARLNEFLDLPDGAVQGPAFFRDAALRRVPLPTE
ncbi:MAG TPA: SchA/CurD-like domain-containing protein [Pseudonocardiaceae bacterium]|jgi:hypothetical protein